VKFYIYRIFDDEGQTLYIGKGSGNRAAAQRSKFSANVEVLERFKKEADAYRREIELIAELKPKLNKHRGGNGSKALKPPREGVSAWQREMGLIGTRAYAARVLLRKGDEALRKYISVSNIEQLREVAYGTRI
jgi:hypothetical protein